MHYTAHVSDRPVPPPVRRSGEPREAHVRVIASVEEFHGRDRPDERADVIVSITDILVALVTQGVRELDAYSLAGIRKGSLEDGTLSLDALRGTLARLREPR